MKNAELYADEWSKLATDRKKEKIESLLAELTLPFIFSGMETFSLNGVTTETIVLNCEGRSFVFVPGCKRAILGWDRGIEGLYESALEDIASSFESVLDPLTWWRRQLALAVDAQDGNLPYFEEQVMELEQNPPEKPDDDLKAFYSFQGLETYVNENTSPVRTADLPPMIVERGLSEAGLIHLGQVNRRTNEHWVTSEHFDRVKDYLYKFNTELTTAVYSRCCRFERTKDDPALYDVYLYERLTYKDLISQLDAEGFALPTEDQWEYLCGAGRRLLFQFGNQFDEDYRYSHMCEEGENILEKPNMFGLSIAYDPYKYELVTGPCQVKGGDGGAALCGGEPFIYTMLPLSAYWRETPDKTVPEDGELENGYYFYRRVLIIE
ncbi:hypothetical protein PC41400_26340 [Paenibacillus chitinolyticus]|uniref:Sulfatase-modifying factor enzyme domain-containing protein n=1 Tax=Paenibacillus chitinolyticus TaxID=79263 RepID=A0A410X313_9BACL|nr:hypothetical protein [Paenibacillus chitinolyticus]MCY9589077.1 hypothetical protein [Paenibacillus chitinolyticus]MCY9595236.1 hypothetical protein [Paenibacillus chitinolyticus]QAV20999.1 hypothetical protein PC41400_26340 [Paenibacillus chitinolyticus]